MFKTLSFVFPKRYQERIFMKKSIVGVVLIVISLAGIIGWETFGREKIIYDEIIVLNESAEPYTEITDDMISLRRVYMPAQGALKPEDSEYLEGKISSQYIQKGSELFQRYFIDKNDAIYDSEYVFSISVSSLLAYPKSVKRGDTVYLQLRNSNVLTSQVFCLKDASGNNIENINRATLSSPLETIELKISDDELEKISAMLDEGERFVMTYNERREQ